MNSIREKIRFHQPEKLAPVLGTKKIKGSECFPTAEKNVLNKSTQLEINPKSVYTIRDEGCDENFLSTSQKKLLPLAGISAKIQENGFNEQECFSLKIGLHIISRMMCTS